MNPQSACHIAPAGHADVPEILAMVRELAEFEHLLHEAVATEGGLAEALFGPRPYAEVLIARVGAGMAGFALFFHNYSTFLGRRGLYLEGQPCQDEPGEQAGFLNVFRRHDPSNS